MLCQYRHYMYIYIVTSDFVSLCTKKVIVACSPYTVNLL